MNLKNIKIGNKYLYCDTTLQANVILTHILKKNKLLYRFQIQKIHYLPNNFLNPPDIILIHRDIVNNYIFDKQEIITNILEI